MTNIKRELQRKNTDKFVDELLKEVERSSNAPFEMQLVHQVQRKLLHLLDDAKERGDDPARINQVLCVFMADCITGYIQLSVPASATAQCFKVAQGMINDVGDIVSQQLTAYTQPPPAPAPTH